MKRTLLLLVGSMLALACRDREIEREISALPVRTEVAKRAEFAPSLALVGVVRASETIPLVAPKDGRVIYAPRFSNGLRTGESVAAGEWIADIRNDQLESQKAQMRLNMDAAQSDLARVQRSFEQGVTSSAEFSAYRFRAQLAKEQYAASQKDLDRQRIVASRAGRLVIGDAIANGINVSQGTKLADIASGGAPIVETSVSAADRELLHRGLTARLAHGAWRGEGTIAEVAPVIDKSGTARVVIRIVKSEAPAPGTGVDVVVELEKHPDVLSVPEDALVAGADGPAVFILGEGGGWRNVYRVKRVAIEAGGRADGRVEVRSGVRDGDRVVIAGADALTDGANVSEAREPRS